MTTAKHAAYTLSTFLTTELNSMATATNSALSAAYDNATNLFLYADWELAVTFGTGPTNGTLVSLYIAARVDGTNYPRAHQSSSRCLGVWSCENTTSRQYLHIFNVPVPPENFKVFARNDSGQTMPASGTTVKAAFHNITIA